MTCNKTTLVICLIGFYLKLACGQPNTPSQVNENENELFRSGKVDLTMTLYSPPTNESRTVVLYATNLTTRNYQLLTSITSINQGIDPAQPKIGYLITTINLNITGFEVKFYSVVISRIVYARLSYLFVDNAFRSLQFYLTDHYLGDGLPGPLAAYSVYNNFSFNMTSRINRNITTPQGSYVLQAYIRGFQIINWNSPQYSIQLSATIQNESYYQISVQSQSSTLQQITDLYVTVIAYNSTWIDLQETRFFKYQALFTSSSLVYSSFDGFQIMERNFFLGVRGFDFESSTSSFYYDFFFDFAGNTVQLNSHFPPLNTLLAFIINVEKRDCLSTGYEYYQAGSHLCFQTCPQIRIYTNETLKKCISCDYDCYTCVNGGNCTTCNKTSYFREENWLSNGSLRCSAISGYYSNIQNSAVAQRCNSTACVQCMRIANNCTKCQTNQYLAIIDNAGSCGPCLDHCLTCVDGATCASCDNFYRLDSVPVCVPACTQFCQLCHVETSPVQALICDTCHLGFYPNTTHPSLCHSLCGDGILTPSTQQCDDNNTLNNDGCSSSCLQQTGYKCETINNDPSIPQKCYYEEEVGFGVGKLEKVKRRNAFRFVVEVRTVNAEVLRELEWARVVVVVGVDCEGFGVVGQGEVVGGGVDGGLSSVEVTFEVNYKPTIKSAIEIQIVPKIHYQTVSTSTSIDQSSTPTYSNPVSSFLTTNPTKFDKVPTLKSTLSLKSQNGMAIIYEPESALTLAQALEYCTMALSLITILLLPVSFTVYGGKIITIECFLVVSCTYFSLVGFKGAQVYSTIEALSGLKLVSFNFIPVAYGLEKKLWWAGLSNEFVGNCLVILVLVVLAGVYCAVIGVLAKYAKDPENIKLLQAIKKKYGFGEVLMTFCLIGAYAFTTNLSLSIINLIKSTTKDIVGISIGIILLLLGIFLFIFLTKKKTYFWQYVQSFYKNSLPEYYINLCLLTIWINSISLVFMADMPYGNVVPIVMSVVWIGLLLKLEPFRRLGEKRRPVVVHVVNGLVQVVFLVMKFKVVQSGEELNSIGEGFLYMPLFIFLLLVSLVGYTIYCLVCKLRTVVKQRKEFLENEKLFRKVPSGKNCQYPLGNSQDPSNTDQCLDKQIMESFRKEKGFNFMSHTMDYEKKELDQKWQNFESVQNTKIDPEKIKDIKKQIRKSAFMAGSNLKEYFNLKHSLNQNPDNNITSNNEHTLPSSAPDQQPTTNHSQNPLPQNHQSTTNHQPNIQQKIITIQYESQKYKEEWKSFFKFNSPKQEEKKHSLAIYDMI